MAPISCDAESFSSEYASSRPFSFEKQGSSSRRALCHIHCQVDLITANECLQGCLSELVPAVKRGGRSNFKACRCQTHRMVRVVCPCNTYFYREPFPSPECIRGARSGRRRVLLFANSDAWVAWQERHPRSRSDVCTTDVNH